MPILLKKGAQGLYKRSDFQTILLILFTPEHCKSIKSAFGNGPATKCTLEATLYGCQGQSVSVSNSSKSSTSCSSKRLYILKSLKNLVICQCEVSMCLFEKYLFYSWRPPCTVAKAVVSVILARAALLFCLNVENFEKPC